MVRKMSETQNPETPEVQMTEAEQAQHYSELVQNRINKGIAYREAGGNPFANRYEPTHQAAGILAAQETLVDSDTVVRVAGRTLTIRSFGKANFFHLLDATGRIQVYVRKGEVPDEDFEVFRKTIDTGDIVGVEGKVMLTKTGELTICATRIVLLTKAYRPLPEKWHGLKDVETRYRQRYLDLTVNEDTRETFRRRSHIISYIRRELDSRGYLEVETPMMQPIYGGAAARPFVTHHNTLDMTLYLRIAPELYLKRLLVGGFDRVYEINRNFRNEGISVRHNPEFTMLELYTTWWNYLDTMNLLEDLLRGAARAVLGTAKVPYLGREVDFESPFARRKMLDLVREALHLPADVELKWGPEGEAGARKALEAAPAHVQAEVKGSYETSDELLVKLFEECAEKNLWQPTVVYDFPKSLCPLAKCSETDPWSAERFEFFVAGLEMANAYSELNDPEEQAANFRGQVERRAKGDEEATMMDEDYVRALEQGMPPASGLGIGIDRLVMLLTDSPSIRDVILFPLMRPE
jgi:lysyl-tRNA synthetase class 2